MADNILELKNITKEFPGVKALDSVSFNIKKGELHTLVGENGAGKSTLMKILSGAYQPTEGKIIYDGNKIQFSDPKEAQNAGISIIHQEFSLIPYLNPVENIFLGHEIRKKNGLLDKKTMKNKAEDILSRLNVQVDLEKPIYRMSIAEQQFVEIAKALVFESKVIIFDEPTASLTGNEIKDLFSLIDSLKNNDVTIIYISHHLDEIFQIGDRLTVLRDGQRIGTKEVVDCSKQDLIKMMVGREIRKSFPERADKSFEKNKPLLRVEKLIDDKGLLKNINFDLYEGEILGVAGLVGAGRTEMVRALIGADKTKEKEVFINGDKVYIKNPSQALDLGIGLIPESRKEHGLVLGMSVKNNISLSVLDQIKNSFGFLNSKKEKEMARLLIEDLSIKTPNQNQLVKNLSGGNQQKVVLAKWLNTKSRVLIFDEPTRGIDVGSKEEIYELITDLADQGLSIILVSSELPEVLGLSDKILVMYEGKQMTEISKEEATSEKIMNYATGGI